MATWKSFVVRHRVEEAEQARQDMVVERCVRRMQQMTHVRVFDRWYEAVQEVKEMRVKVNVVLKRWQTREYVNPSYYIPVLPYLHLRTPAIHVYTIYTPNTPLNALQTP